MDLTGIVLAGGRSRRLGRDKALEPIGQQSLIRRVLGRLPDLDEIIVVTSPDFVSVLNGQHLGVRLETDVFSDVGPLGGIHSGLLAAQGEYGVVVGCDMPFLNQELLEYMIGMRAGYDIVIPRMAGLLEPLHAVYSKDCTSIIERHVQQGRMGVHELLQTMRVRYVEEEEVDRLDPKHMSFFNVNSDVDMKRARELAKREGRC